MRVWLELVDHSSSASIPVKLYLDREQWTMALAALPGTTVILTNLLYKLSIKNGGFSHLESSTETQVGYNKLQTLLKVSEGVLWGGSGGWQIL